MKTRKNYFFMIITLVMILVGCSNKTNTSQQELLKQGIHTVLVKELIPTTQYTYFRLMEIGNPDVKESDSLWAAVPAMDAKVGDTLYYKGGYPMKDFKSRELGITFKDVLFLDSLSATTDFNKGGASCCSGGKVSCKSDSVVAGKPKIQKAGVKIAPVAGGVTIAELYANSKKYDGKVIKVRGQVVKFNPEIMGKNWVHIQDGTESGGNFDLTVTTGITAKEGDVIIFEGKIALNKDFGYGYFYEVLMEDATKAN